MGNKCNNMLQLSGSECNNSEILPSSRSNCNWAKRAKNTGRKANRWQEEAEQEEQKQQHQEQLQRPLASDLAKGYERYHRCFHNNRNHNTSKYSTPGEDSRRWRGRNIHSEYHDNWCEARRAARCKCHMRRKAKGKANWDLEINKHV